MKLFSRGHAASYVFAIGLLVGVSNQATASFVYVTDTTGQIWKYDSIVPGMAAQTQTNNAGTLVATRSGYATDQDHVADWSTGKIYRITNSGNIVQYNTLNDFLNNSNSTTVANAIYTNNMSKANAIIGASYDGATGGFFAVKATGASLQGDIVRFSNLAAFLSGVPDVAPLGDSGYTGAKFVFWAPDAVVGTTANNQPNTTVNYYQVSGGGALEGFATLSAYQATSNNRVNITASNAFGDTVDPITSFPYQAGSAFSWPSPVPELTSVLVWFVGICCVMTLRRL